MLIDPEGTAWFLFNLAVGIIGAVVAAATQVAINVTTGESVFKNVGGAAAGGFVYNIVALHEDAVCAGYASAAAESIVNEAVSYITGEKEVNNTNIDESMQTVLRDTAINGTIYASTGLIAEEVVNINKNWYKPQKLRSVLFGNYTRRVIRQTIVQAAHNYVALTTKSIVINSFNTLMAQ